MSYSIETRTVSEFVTDNSIRLPRFQRKSTWSPQQNFELAISMFKEYPLGVVVINDERGTSWLLDGRQRRNALKELRDNPDAVYDAAKSYIGFKAKESPDEVRRLFWQKVSGYISTSASMTDQERADEAVEDDEETQEEDINRERQQEGLNVLLDIILMVHQKKKDTQSGMEYGTWERLFKLDRFLSNIPYAPRKENFRINPERLHAFLLAIGQKAQNEGAELTEDYFIGQVDEMIKDGQEDAFSHHVHLNWPDMSKVIDVVQRSEIIFRRARIGVISIKNVTPLDAQNIFSKINSGGTPLSPEELISAKPFWNEPVFGVDSDVHHLVTDLYNRLDVSPPSDGNVVRWDLAATLMARIRDGHLIFEDFRAQSEKSEAKRQKYPEISFGFRLLASYFMKGISKVQITALEQNREIEWPGSVDDFVYDFNRMCDVLLKNDFFRQLSHWGRPMSKLIGASASFEFCSVLFNEWKRLGEPTQPGADRNNLYRKAKALFDNLVFEYASGQWKGSGDSKMAKHLRQPENRFKPLDKDTWISFISEISTSGTYNGQTIVKANIEPLIYYQFVLRNLYYPMDNVRYEIDHIIPQSLLKDNAAVPEWFKDSIANLSILPRNDNSSKRDMPLSAIRVTDPTLANMISKFIGIPLADFDKYSNLNNIPDLISTRKEMLLTTFGERRLDLLKAD